ncbi:hypothetical protein CLV47_110102 [Antricoccus suffuscus]|uniref:DUF308 domain-containing protein n=1 Tax=Antricoccus suffuscus TaxID=1629062 RepID=A0A2T0ZYK5_9ACTN|nr:DUF308 domain-containing protein [Antricoccus suffuscus]PRZ41374.1 hypothetical protein CLV47_110102 [Antricoccus suffuscus]
MSTNWPEPRPRRRRGRRDNGLDAASYVKVRLVDPRVGEHLLDVLREARVAAYLDPISSNDPYRLVEPPSSPPFEHLYVDAQLRSHAQQVLDGDGPDSEPTADVGGPDPFDLDNDQVDALFAELVGHYDSTATNPTRRTEASEPDAAPTDQLGTDGLGIDHLDINQLDTDESSGGQQPIVGQAEVSDEPPVEPEVVDVWRGSYSLGPAADDPLDHYEPPEPDPIKRPSRPAIVAILVLLAGVLMLFFPQVLGIGGTTAVVLGVLGITSGVGLLLLRLREDPPDGEEDDDGAVV